MIINSYFRISGLPSQGSAACHLLPRVALARSAVAPRTEATRAVPVSVQRQAEGGVHQSVSL